eukprot:6289317-Prymnesium_polylepis.1
MAFLRCSWTRCCASQRALRCFARGSRFGQAMLKRHDALQHVGRGREDQVGRRRFPTAARGVA